MNDKKGPRVCEVRPGEDWHTFTEWTGLFWGERVTVAMAGRVFWKPGDNRIAAQWEKVEKAARLGREQDGRGTQPVTLRLPVAAWKSLGAHAKTAGMRDPAFLRTVLAAVAGVQSGRIFAALAALETAGESDPAPAPGDFRKSSVRIGKCTRAKLSRLGDAAGMTEAVFLRTVLAAAASVKPGRIFAALGALEKAGKEPHTPSRYD